MQESSRTTQRQLAMWKCFANTSVTSFRVGKTLDIQLSHILSKFYHTGKVTDNSIITEGLFSLSNLMVLFNDQIIRRELLKGQARDYHNDTEESIKLFLTVLENLEVLIEITSKQIFGKNKKFVIICIIQAVK